MKIKLDGVFELKDILDYFDKLRIPSLAEITKEEAKRLRQLVDDIDTTIEWKEEQEKEEQDIPKVRSSRGKSADELIREGGGINMLEGRPFEIYLEPKPTPPSVRLIRESDDKPI
ncbi:MAG: hypothetical protein AABY32_00795 [Nanoarchaeota archaeon]